MGFVTVCKRSPKVCRGSQGVDLLGTDPEGNNLSASSLIFGITSPRIRTTLKDTEAWVKGVILRQNPKDPQPIGGGVDAVYTSQS